MGGAFNTSMPPRRTLVDKLSRLSLDIFLDISRYFIAGVAAGVPMCLSSAVYGGCITSTHKSSTLVFVLFYIIFIFILELKFGPFRKNSGRNPRSFPFLGGVRFTSGREYAPPVGRGWIRQCTHHVKKW